MLVLIVIQLFFYQSDNQKKSMSIVLSSCTHFGRKSAALGSAQQNPRCIPSVGKYNNYDFRLNSVVKFFAD